MGTGVTLTLGRPPKGDGEKPMMALLMEQRETCCMSLTLKQPTDSGGGKTRDASRQFARRKSITSIKKWIRFPLEQTAQGSAIILQHSQYLL